MKPILIIHTKSGLNDLSGKEALDMSLILASYDQQVQLLFMQHGVTQVLAQQQPEQVQQKDYISTFKALELYDVDDVFACQSSLDNLVISSDQLLSNVIVLSTEEINSLVENAQQVFVF